ncbi:MAG: hypothetical protein IPJ41_04215 [Phycisphaerales bacterium]|nr:hypothetical protein [Phycisphaerales bacterium]
MPDAKVKVHAVVWRSPASAVPRDLVAALARQGVTWQEASGPFEALAELLATRRDGAPSRVLLLVEPRTLGEADEVRRALLRFDPAVRCWGFAEGANPRLTPLAPLPPIADQEIHIRPAPARAETPRLRLSGEGPNQAAEAEHPAESGSQIHQMDTDENPGSRPPRSLLTAEELDMLLADDR